MTITWKPTLLITYYFIFGQALKILLIVLMPGFVCFAVLQPSSLNVVFRVLVEYSQIDIWCQTGRKQSIYYKGYRIAYNIYMLEILLSVYLTIFNYCFFLFVLLKFVLCIVFIFIVKHRQILYASHNYLIRIQS